MLCFDERELGNSKSWYLHWVGIFFAFEFQMLSLYINMYRIRYEYSQKEVKGLCPEAKNWIPFECWLECQKCCKLATDGMVAMPAIDIHRIQTILE